MARRLAVCLLAALAILAGPSPARSPSTGNNPRGYADLGAVAKAYGLVAAPLSPGGELKLQSRWTQLAFTTGSREASWNGIRLFLGEPIRAQRTSLFISPVDYQAVLRPLLDPAAVPSPGPLKLIAIDAGHGGGDPGTENRPLGLKEKHLTLDVVRRLKKDLEQRGYRVMLTRSTDTRLAATQRADLARRAAVANKNKADLFISIHFNSLPGSPATKGVETYALTPAGQRSTAAHQASRSDKVVQPGNRFDHWNAVLSAALHRNLLDRLGAVDRGLKRARFAVLRAIECPAVLVEAGFVSNGDEARKLGTPAYRQDIAEAIAEGVEDYDARLQQAAAD